MFEGIGFLCVKFICLDPSSENPISLTNVPYDTAIIVFTVSPVEDGGGITVVILALIATLSMK